MIVYLNNKRHEIPNGAMLADLISIADEKLHLGDRGMCALNGVLCAKYDIPLKEDDRIIFIPALEGG